MLQIIKYFKCGFLKNQTQKYRKDNKDQGGEEDGFIYNEFGGKFFSHFSSEGGFIGMITNCIINITFYPLVCLI